MIDFVAWCQNNRAFDTFLKSHLSPVDLWILRVVCKGFSSIIPKQPDKPVNILTAAQEGHLGALKTLCRDRSPKIWTQFCVEAAKCGNMEVLEWMKQMNFGIDACNYNMFFAAAGQGHLDVLKWLVNDNFTNIVVDSAACSAARNGHLKILEWMKKKGYLFGVLVCEHAALGGQLEILKWLRENGCEWRDTCFYAAQNGHLEVLKWARENGCPWGTSEKWICISAARSGHFEVARWARDNGCVSHDITIRVRLEKVKRYLSELTEWCKENGHTLEIVE